MNPLARLFIYIIFSISILLSKNASLLIFHICLVLIIVVQKRAVWDELLDSIKPYWIYLPLSGLFFVLISLIVSKREISVILVDVLMATFRLYTIISLMTLYVVNSKSQNIFIALRSMWYSTRSTTFWIDKMILFLEMTLRFFPLIQKDWNQTHRSQKALSFNQKKTLKTKVLNIAIFIPDFIIINLQRTENIIESMSMRGYGRHPRRSIYPFVEFKLYDFFICSLILVSMIGIHYYV